MISPLRRPIPTLSLFALSCLCLASALFCSKPSKPVAKVGDEWVGRERWQAYLKGANVEPDAPIPQKEKALKGLVRRSVAVALAQKRGLLKAENSAELSAMLADQITAFAFVEERVKSQPAFTDAEVREYFDSKTEERFLRHILCATEAEAKSVAESLRGGKPFKEVLKAHTLDKESISKDGEMGSFRRMDLPPAVAEAAFKAEEGIVLEPVQGKKGWEVLVTGELKKPADATFALQKDQVLTQMKSERTERVRRELIEECQKRFNLVIHNDAVPDEAESPLLPADSTAILAEVGSEKITLKDLKLFVKAGAQRPGGQPPRGKAEVSKYITVLSGQKAVLASARQAGFHKRKEVLAMIWNAEQDRAARAFANSYLQEAPVSKEALQAFYDQNKEGFRGPSRVLVRIIRADNPERLKLAVEAHRKGTPLAQVEKQFGVKALNGGTAVPFDFQNPPQGFPPQALRAISSAPVGKWLAPFQSESGVAAYGVAETKPGEILTPEQLGDSLRIAYVNQNGQTLLETFLEGEGSKGIKIETFPQNL